MTTRPADYYCNGEPHQFDSSHADEALKYGLGVLFPYPGAPSRKVALELVNRWNRIGIGSHTYWI